MQVTGFGLKASDGSFLQKWATVPARIDLPNGGIIFCATSDWSDGDYSIAPVTWDEPDPVPFVPQIISDRQFFQQLAVQGVITDDEALAAVGPGTLPAALSKLIDGLPSDQQFPAKMLLVGAVQFDRKHPMVAVLGQAFGWSDAQLDSLWTNAAAL